MNDPTLAHLGLNTTVEEQFAPLRRPGMQLGRIAAVRASMVDVYTDEGRVRVHVAGKVRYRAAERGLPFAGDWVAVERMPSGDLVLQEILPRSTVLLRKAAGMRTDQQILAVNVDVAMC